MRELEERTRDMERVYSHDDRPIDEMRDVACQKRLCGRTPNLTANAERRKISSENHWKKKKMEPWFEWERMNERERLGTP